MNHLDFCYCFVELTDLSTLNLQESRISRRLSASCVSCAVWPASSDRRLVASSRTPLVATVLLSSLVAVFTSLLALSAVYCICLQLNEFVFFRRTKRPTTNKRKLLLNAKTIFACPLFFGIFCHANVHTFLFRASCSHSELRLSGSKLYKILQLP